MKRPWLVAALVLVLGAAFLVQATSTVKLGQHHNLADLALPALVILLEVGSVTAAAIFFRSRSTALRLRALVMLAITAGLGAYGGVRSYGVVVGLFVAVMLVGLVEVVGAYRRETTLPQQDNQDHQPEPEWSGPETVELPRLSDTRPEVVEDEPAPTPRPLQAVGWSVEAIVADLREQGRTDPDQRGLQRFIRDTYSVGAAKALEAIDELRKLRTVEVAS